MAVPRLFIEGAFASGVHVALDEDQARYLVSVLRLSHGAALRVFNASEGDWAANLMLGAKKRVEIQLERQLRTPQPCPDLMLLFAPVKRHATDLIVEKATELGVRAIQPVTTRRTVADSVRLERWRAIAREAAEQSERTDLPTLHGLAPLGHILGAWENNRVLIYADEQGSDAGAPWGGARGRAEDITATLKTHAPEKMALLIGPEGGFETEERAFLRSLPFVRAVSLGPRILRAETAVIVGLTLVQAHWGDWRNFRAGP